jgi:hypothetical protein
MQNRYLQYTVYYCTGTRFGLLSLLRWTYQDLIVAKPGITREQLEVKAQVQLLLACSFCSENHNGWIFLTSYMTVVIDFAHVSTTVTS